jgi:hypothetical protein
VEFLNPFALVAMAAVAVPLFLHLFNLRRPKTVDFSSLAFIKELQKSAVQRVRIKEWLLLALRMLAIACLVAAFARPTLTGNFAAVGDQVRTAHAVVVDNSLSMTVRDGEGAYAEQARRQARGVLETADETDDVLVWPTARSGDGTPSITDNLALAQQAVDEIRPRAGATSLGQAVVRAAEQLQASDAPRKVVYVVSDLQASTLGDSLATSVPEETQVTLLPVGTRTPSNVGVTDVRVVSRIAEVGQPVRLEATLVNYGSEPLPGYVASVFLQDERVAQSTTTLEPNTPTTVSFTATPQSRGWLTGRVEVEDDDFADDNQRRFTLHVPKERRVLTVRGAGQDTRFVDLALSSQMIEDRIAFQTTTIEESELTASELGAYDAVLLVGPQTLSSGEVSALARYVNQGGGLMLFPNSQARPEDYNALFEAIDGGSFRGFSGAQGGDRSIAAFDRVDLEHPLFEGVFDRPQRGEETRVESPDVYYAMNYRPAGGGEQTLIELSNGFPFLQEVRHGGGVALVAAVAPSPAWSDLPVRGLFIPLLYRSVYYLSAGTSVAGEQLTAGAESEVRITGIPPEASLRIVGPEGVERSPEQRTLFGAVLMQTGGDLDVPGIYDVFAGETLVRRLAVNVDAAESDLRRADPSEASSTLGEATGASVRVLDGATPDARAVADALRTQRAGTEIWNVFLLLALGFLVAEMLVASQWKPETATA